jgi:hypothetical protein
MTEGESNAENASKKHEESVNENKSKLDELKEKVATTEKNAFDEEGGPGETYKEYLEATEELENFELDISIKSNAATLPSTISNDIKVEITKDLTQKVSEITDENVQQQYIERFAKEGTWADVTNKIGNKSRLTFENPYSVDSIFIKKNPKTGEPIKTWKDKLTPPFLKDLINPEKLSPFAQELAKKARDNPEYAEALRQMKQTQIDVFTFGVEKPILELTGKTKTEIQSDMKKIDDDKNMNETQKLSAKIDYGNKLLEEHLEKIKEKAGDKKATDWYKWISLIGVLASIGFGVWAACTVACDLAAAMDGCYAISPQGEKMQTDIVPPPNLECSTDGNSSSGNECKKKLSEDDKKKGDKPCCNTCGGCLKGRAHTCATSNCCGYERDKLGFPDNKLSTDLTKSTRKDYKYQYECYTGLGAFNKLLGDAMKNVLNLGSLGKILITAAIVIGCLLGAYFLIELILSFVRKKSK